MSRRFRIVSAVALCLLPVALQAQGGMGAPRGIKFGILLGAGVSTISDAKKAAAAEFTAALDTKRRKGLDGGIFVQIPIAGMVSLQPEAHYAQKGVTLSATEATVGAINLDLKIDYVEIPVLLRLDIGSQNSMIHPVLLGGASVAMRLSCKTSLSAAGSSTTTDCDVNGDGTSMPDPFKKQDYGLVGGAGLALSGAGRTFLLQLRYNQGLTTVASKDAQINGASIKNATFSLLLGVGF
jgi:hypothetical protein